MELGMIGLGRMGLNMSKRLMSKGHKVLGYARRVESVKRAIDIGAIGTYSIDELVQKLPLPRTIWLMIPAGDLGIYPDLDEASNKMIKTTGRHEPNLRNYQKYGAIYKLYKELYFASKKFYEELSRIIAVNNE